MTPMAMSRRSITSGRCPTVPTIRLPLRTTPVTPPPIWWVSRSVTPQDASGNTVRQSWTYYDGATDWTTAPTKGNATKSESWLAGGANPVVTRIYDQYGNRTDEFDAMWNATSGTQGNHVQVTFDVIRHQYPVKVFNALDQTEISTFDPVTGELLAHTDMNGQTTRSVYDAFGRVIKLIGPGDSEAYPTRDQFIQYFQFHAIVR
jgi:hypothetical protein